MHQIRIVCFAFLSFSLAFRTLVPSSALVKAYPDTADEKFAKHWDTWFTQDELNTLVAAGINTVRIPVSIFSIFFALLDHLCPAQLGYWIVEDLVDRSKEYYPRGGLKYLVSFLCDTFTRAHSAL